MNHNIFCCKKKQKLSNVFVYLKIEAAGSHSITTSRSYVPISPSEDKSTDTTVSVYSDSRVSIKFKRFCSEFGIKIKMVSIHLLGSSCIHACIPFRLRRVGKGLRLKKKSRWGKIQIMKEVGEMALNKNTI